MQRLDRAILHVKMQCCLSAWGFDAGHAVPVLRQRLRCSGRQDRSRLRDQLKALPDLRKALQQPRPGIAAGFGMDRKTKGSIGGGITARIGANPGCAGDGPAERP